MTPEQQQLHASNNRFNSTVAEGAAVGAVGGALIGYLSGGTKGALIGAGAGLATGGAAGYLVAQNNYTQARTEQNYRTAIADAQTQAAAFQKDATLSETVAAQAMSRAAELNAQYRAHTISAEQYRSSIAQYENTIHDLDAKNAAAQQQISALQKSIAVTPASQAAPFRDALHTIEQDNKRIAAAKERLRQVTLSAPASA
ncbi:MAG: hypothetical protein B7Z80_18660 [Rhodospirillales bacterium 20-64-7]|nr:MAG: hypothetical protein B7Z80_18660 [Rhodospirillales bacterium 20-64-7]